MQYQPGPGMARPHARFNNFHGAKRQLVGHGPVQPAWKANAVAGPAALKQQNGAGMDLAGSKIFLSRLPTDVTEKEVEELFKKTVGPVKDCFLIYNSQGNSKGMAVVSFAKVGDAAEAKKKYHGKIVDGRKPLKIEIIVDDISKAGPAASSTRAVSQPRSLLQRLGGIAPAGVAPAPAAALGRPPAGAINHRPQPAGVPLPIRLPFQPRNQPRPGPVGVVGGGVPVAAARRRPVKKGPKRVAKRPLTAAELDQEMEEYQKTALLEVEMTS